MNANNLPRQMVIVFATVVVIAVLVVPFLLVALMMLPVAPCVLPAVIAAFVGGNGKAAALRELPIGIAIAIPEPA